MHKLSQKEKWKRIKIVQIFIVLLISLSCKSQLYVSGVRDGDTFYAATMSFRLAEIDCPELGQDFGDSAKKYLSSKILHKQVTVKIVGYDIYNRTVVKLYIGNDYINADLVRDGLAWAYKKYASEPIYNLYLSARENRIGLWSENDPDPPFIYRKKHKK